MSGDSTWCGTEGKCRGKNRELRKEKEGAYARGSFNGKLGGGHDSPLRWFSALKRDASEKGGGEGFRVLQEGRGLLQGIGDGAHRNNRFLLRTRNPVGRKGGGPEEVANH